MLRSAVLGAVLLSSSGCSLSNQPRLDPIATSFQKPSRVALYVAVSGESASLEPLSHAVAGFIEGVRGSQSVSVLAFDGRPSLRLVAEFPKSQNRAPLDPRALTQVGRSDSSRNLNGALQSGLKELDARL
jgi:hypothetical protein